MEEEQLPVKQAWRPQRPSLRRRAMIEMQAMMSHGGRQ